MSFFKDISNYLSKKYPNRNVYVISDHHINHKNIIELTRNNFSINDEPLKAMNEYIINEHNKVVDKEDIVIMLGDFSFKRSITSLSKYISRMNGHKILILGNHDKTDKISLYIKAGFEDVYLYPIKFNEDYYSHYPLNASKESKDRPSNILYDLLYKEFSANDSGINYHGHQHALVNNGDREKNVTCEQLDYKPLFVGKTKSNIQNDELPYIDEEFFDIMHKIMFRYNIFKDNTLITDYLYTILLDILSKYKDKIATFGSVLLNKKYNTQYNPSDLDITKLFDSNKSIKENRKELKIIANDIFENMNKINNIHVDFYKKIDFICILSFVYATQNYNIKGYLDMNCLLDEFHKSSDFIELKGNSLLEQYANKANIALPNTIKYPKYDIKTTSILADITNCFLQYIYINDNEKKKALLVKLNRLIKNINISTFSDFDQLQNMLIRYLLRNIYFFESARRKRETNLILHNRQIEMPSIDLKDNTIGDALRIIVNSGDYNLILDSISNADDKKREVSNILKYYK